MNKVTMNIRKLFGIEKRSDYWSTLASIFKGSTGTLFLVKIRAVTGPNTTQLVFCHASLPPFYPPPMCKKPPSTAQSRTRGNHRVFIPTWGGVVFQKKAPAAQWLPCHQGQARTGEEACAKRVNPSHHRSQRGALHGSPCRRLVRYPAAVTSRSLILCKAASPRRLWRSKAYQ